MSNHANDPTDGSEWIQLVAIPTTPVTQFLFRGFMYTSVDDLPFHHEWTAWASAFPTLKDVWEASGDPEMLLFMHHWAGFVADVSEPAPQLLARFGSSALRSAGIDAELEAEVGSASERNGLLDWFGAGSNLPVALARRAVHHAVEVRSGQGESPRAVRKELADTFRELAGNPFLDSDESDCTHTFWEVVDP